MTSLMNAVACFVALLFSNLLWRNKISLLKESVLLLGCVVLSGLFAFFTMNPSDPMMELFPFRMVALCICFSSASLPVKRRRYLVLAQMLWLWVEFFGGLSLYYRGIEIPWTRIVAIFAVGFGSCFLSRITREMEFCLMVYWIAIWMFF